MKLWRSIVTCALLLLASLAAHAKPVNYGGSNHWLYATGTADGSNVGNSWYLPAQNIRPVVGMYQLNATLVQQQMAAARASGQFAYVLPIATGSLAACETGACNDGVIDGVWGEVSNYESSGLNVQQQNNLKAIITYANQLGFRRIVIRFNHYDSPWYWTSWNEPLYQKMWNYVWNTHNMITAHRAAIGSTMEILYDLGGEYGGVAQGQGQQFNTRLWADYVSVFSNADTLGFSIAYEPGRFTAQKAWYGGTLPKWWAFDIYPGSTAANSGATMTANLNSILGEMGTLRNQPIIVLESWFNDANVAGGIQNAITGNRLLNIDMVSQWPTTYTMGHFSAAIVGSLNNSSVVFGNYLPLLGARAVSYSSSNADVMAVADQTCSSTTSSPCAVTLVLGAPPAGSLNVVYVNTGGSTVLVACQGGGDLSIPWIGAYSSYSFSVYRIASCPSVPPGGAPAATSTIKL